MIIQSVPPPCPYDNQLNIKKILQHTLTQNQSRPGVFKLYRLLFWSGLVLALLLRIFALLALKDSLNFKFLLWDGEYYHEWAKAILLSDPGSIPVHEYAPLPAYLMALVYKLFGPEIVLIRYANIVLGTASCWLIYLIGKN